MTRVALGIDPGTKRIGFALGDDLGGLATPLCVWERRGLEADLHRVKKLVEEHQVGVVVVGVPYKLEGGESHSTRKAKELLEAVRAALPGVEVVEQDEALTTWEADETLKSQGLSPQERRKKIDMFAAAVLLQEWLDHHRQPDRPGQS